MLLVGTQWHLWYMVFGLVASLGAFFARRYTQRIDGRLIIMLASLLGCAVMVLEREFAGVPARAAAWLLAIPSIPIGIALGRCLWEENRRTRIWNTILTFAIVCGGMAALEVRHWGYSADRYMLAILPVCLVVLWRGVPDAFTAWLTRLRMGVYLIHPLMIRVFMSLLGDHSNAVVRTVVVILASIGCVWLMSKSPLRWMVLTRAVEETDRSGPPRVHRFRGAWKHAA
jgi:peptidoglycan/LPS O-acetylase OafA/YrhL